MPDESPPGGTAFTIRQNKGGHHALETIFNPGQIHKRRPGT